MNFQQIASIIATAFESTNSKKSLALLEHIEKQRAMMAEQQQMILSLIAQPVRFGKEEKAKNKIYFLLLEMSSALVNHYVPLEERIKLTKLQMQVVPPEMVVELKSIIDAANAMPSSTLEKLVSGKLELETEVVIHQQV